MVSIAVTALRVLLLAVCLYGWLQAFCRRTAAEFAPLLLAAALSCTLLAAGLLNLLPHAAWALTAAGVWLAVQSARKKQSPAALCCPGLLFFAAAALYFIFLLQSGKVNHWDDYSHWGAVVRTMLSTDRLPNFSDVSVTFSSYPVGHSLLLYFFGCITGIRAEGLWLIAQALLLLCAVVPLFAFARGSRPAQALTALCCLLLLAGNTRFDNLLVDTLLPLTAVGAFAYCLYYRGELRARLPGIALLAVYVMNIKNSGLLFALLLALYVLLHAGGPRRARLRAAGTLVLAQAAAYLLWHRHVQLVFAQGDLNGHAMTVQNYLATLGGKSAADVRGILLAVAGRLFTPVNPAWVLLALALLLAALRRRLHAEGPGAGWAVGAYAAYMAGLAAMYVLSMSRAEAAQLAAFERYHLSILQFVGGVLPLQLLGVLRARAAAPRPALRTAGAGLILLAALGWALLPRTACPGQPFLIEGAPYLVHYDRREVAAAAGWRTALDAAVRQSGIPCGTGQRCFVIADAADGDEAGYLWSALTYVLGTREVTVVTPEGLAARGAEWAAHDLLLDLAQNDASAAWLKTTFGAAGPFIDLSLYR